MESIEKYKIDYYFKYYIYKFFGYTFDKLASQQNYWEDRGQVYMDEILASGYLEREVFFQDMLIHQLKKLKFDSFFEAGCGFGWNLKRVQDEFPDTRVGGLDFSKTQLANGRQYLKDYSIELIHGDNCAMPYGDKTLDIGFSLGVFMNIHPDKIMDALKEMKRVCKKYIIHIEYDENNTTPQLKEKRAFKTNIVSHDYKNLYQSIGLKVLDFRTHLDFGDAWRIHQKKVSSKLQRWEGFEGPEKYIFILLEVPNDETP